MKVDPDFALANFADDIEDQFCWRRICVEDNFADDALDHKCQI